MNDTISWDYYTTRINKNDRFLTRYYHFLRFRKVITILDSIFQKHELLHGLDIGCSYGWYSNILISKGVQSVDAIDSTSYQESVITDSRITFYKGDFLTVELEKKYDIILAFEVYEHIPERERPAFLDKIATLLNPGGILIFSGPNSISMLYGCAFIVSFLKQYLASKKGIDWHYRIPFFYYNRILENDYLTIIKWETNGVFALYPHSLERIMGKTIIQSVADFDNLISPLLKGLGANYYCVIQRK